MASKQKVVVIGAGPVGSLAALYAARRGHNVEVYELRSDLRDPGTVPLNFTKSINLAVSERGINALRHVGHPGLLESIMEATIPMRGRMIHGTSLTGELSEEAQDYDAQGRPIYAVDRKGLNSCLLDALDSLPNVKLFFDHKLTGADFRQRKAWLEARNREAQANGRPREIEISFDLMIGADGAHSAVRYHMMKFSRMDYQQEYIDTLWCEFHIDPVKYTSESNSEQKFRISPNHLHIWPGKEFMFIAIPSEDGSFTCTLFSPSSYFDELSKDPSSIPAFFDQYFPGVTSLITREALISSYQESPHLPLISLKCKPYHHDSSGVIIGDAAHAMVPFYGQGMNAGMEDVHVLFNTLDKHLVSNTDDAQDTANVSISETVPVRQARALKEYSIERAPDVYAINNLALQNYVEMRASVLSWGYRTRKFLEESMSVYFPSWGWHTRYFRVSFSNERYSEVVRRSEYQGKMLMRTLVGVLVSPFVFTGAFFGYRYRGAIKSLYKGATTLAQAVPN